jgi:hypothetical protein|tara:strand:+ start:2288 stop:2479 length:192 start_codon:yes stop_codon:yes gene_type:complete
MYTEEYTSTILEIATLLDLEVKEVTNFLELMLDGYGFTDALHGTHLTRDDCELVLAELKKRKK